MHRCISLIALLSTTVLLSGCFYSREIVHTRRDIERHYPDARFDREVVVSVGPGALRALGWVTGLVPEEEAQMARDYLHEIERVKVGVYRTEHLPPLENMDLPALRRFERYWPIVRPAECCWRMRVAEEVGVEPTRHGNAPQRL